MYAWLRPYRLCGPCFGSLFSGLTSWPCFSLLFPDLLVAAPFVLRRRSTMAGPVRRFRFANWNAHSVLNKRQEIEAMLSLGDLDMLCITETWLDPDSVFEFFDYLAFRCDRRLGRGGAALILVRSKFAVTDLDLSGAIDGGLDAVGLSVCSSSP